jgi:VIT1/CCC1 family predicted Fe2+/Mn2+ transporter
MTKSEARHARRVLDPIERVSEMIFGLLMAMTFIGSLSVATAGQQDVRTAMIAALGCNLAWGLADAVMYLVATLTDRTRSRTLLARLRAQDAAGGRRLVAEVLPPWIVATAGEDGLELLRSHLAETPNAALAPRLGRDDFKGALGVFLVVVIATFPVVVPFMVFTELAPALLASRLVALAMLFFGGWMLARYSGGSRWLGGFGLAGVGALLLAAIMALGG